MRAFCVAPEMVTTQNLEMLKSNFFRSKNFNVFYDWRTEKITGKARARSNCNEKFTALGEKFSARNENFLGL